MLGSCGSKAAVNTVTVQLAYELRDTAIKFNSVNPGFTATDMDGHQGSQTGKRVWLRQSVSRLYRRTARPED